ncbi:MAG TPA: hypothetical protein VGZ22_19920 [Isosphaeraceae bacterium]|jgi:hypothetical protein|nr:hypothetical protein [Isosphaeraceae bacterium]
MLMSLQRFESWVRGYREQEQHRQHQAAQALERASLEREKAAQPPEESAQRKLHEYQSQYLTNRAAVFQRVAERIARFRAEFTQFADQWRQEDPDHDRAIPPPLLIKRLLGMLPKNERPRGPKPTDEFSAS